MVEIWNGRTGVKPITKFANRKSATERIWKALQHLGEQAVAPFPETPFDAPEAPAVLIELPQGDTLRAEIEPVALTPPDATGAAEPVASGDEPEPQVAPAEKTATEMTSPSKKTPKAKKAAKPAKSEKRAGSRDGSKTARVVAMLQREKGASLAEIMEQMGWQKHTVRGFMAGAMKKAGYTVESFKSDKGERSYRINP